jgi:hypothetical protein
MKKAGIFILGFLLVTACHPIRNIAITEHNGKLHYYHEPSKLRLIFYGDYIFETAKRRRFFHFSPAVQKEIAFAKINAHKGRAFLQSRTYIYPWIWCSAYLYPLPEETINDTTLIHALPSGKTDLKTIPFLSFFDQRTGYKLTYKTADKNNDSLYCIEYLLPFEQQLVRVAFTTPDSTAENLNKEAAQIFNNLDKYIYIR